MTNGSYAVASLLTLMALVTLALKVFLEHRTVREVEEVKAAHAEEIAA